MPAVSQSSRSKLTGVRMVVLGISWSVSDRTRTDA